MGIVSAAVVVVELFTSEGCSSCPPADALLDTLDRKNAEVIALEHHVDYWNDLGWRDPFSAERFTARQDEYRRASGGRSLYTPQMIVDGARSFVGSDAGEAAEAIAQAARAPKAAVKLARAGEKLRIEVAGAPRGAIVLLAVTERGLETQVPRGENAGRRLRHGPVVRSLEIAGEVGKDGAFAAEVPVILRPEWNRDALRTVVLVQERPGGRIAGAAALESSGARPPR